MSTFSDIYNTLRGKYVPRTRSDGKPVPVCCYCHNQIRTQGLRYRPEQVIFDTEACMEAMLGRKPGSAEITTADTLAGLVQMNAVKQPQRGDTSPKTLEKRVA